MDVCTVAALMRSPLLRFPNPSCSSQGIWFFGFGGLTSCLIERITSLLWTGQYYLANPFSRRLTVGVRDSSANQGACGTDQRIRSQR